MIKKIGYYLFSSYRRKNIDKLLNENIGLYKGKVLDIGGRQRGSFKPPKDAEWITADIEKSRNPDIVLDVANMEKIDSESIDVINAIELFEHVEKIEDGLKECYRILKKDGSMILSIPFLFPVHADPYDFQRWTETKWRKEVEKKGFQVENMQITGRIFTVLADGIKSIVESFPKMLWPIGFIFYPMLDCLVKLDRTKFVLSKKRLSNYHGGYFVVLKK